MNEQISKSDYLESLQNFKSPLDHTASLGKIHIEYSVQCACMFDRLFVCPRKYNISKSGYL